MRTQTSPDLAQVLVEAQDIASSVNQQISSTHLLLAVFTVPNRAQVLLRDRGIDEDRILEKIKRHEKEHFSYVDTIIDRAKTLAAQLDMPEVECLHLLVAVLRTRDIAAHRLLVETGVDLVSLRNQAMSYLTGNMPRRMREAMQGLEALETVYEPNREFRNADPSYNTGSKNSSGYKKKPLREEDLSNPSDYQGRRAIDSADNSDATEDRGLKNHQDESRIHSPDFEEISGNDLDFPEQNSTAINKDNQSPVYGGAGSDNIKKIKAVKTSSPDQDKDQGEYVLDAEEYPWLSSLGRNLTQLASEGAIDPLIGRERELEEVIDVLGKRRANNPVLVGEAGVGKTAIVEGVAKSLLDLGKKGSSFGDKIVIELDMASILAGTHLRGSFSEKLCGIKDEVKQAGGRVVVFIDEIHTLIGAGATDGPQDAANELKSALARGEFPCVGATTHDEYRKFIEQDAALERRFTPVLVSEPSEEDACKILSGLIDGYAKHHQVKYQPEALNAAVRLSARYITDRCLPDKAIGIIDLAGSRARREARENIDVIDIARVISKVASVPEERLLMTDRERFLRMEESLGARVIGHGEALSLVSQAVRRNYAGFDNHRPMGSFLFMGPTGVGKTETAKALADFLFGTSDALVRLDMSEFGESNTSARLIGSPPGYVGYGEGGQLTEQVRRRPFSVVLFDEMEKAHGDVLQLLLQVLDEGCLTDGRGRQVTFSNTVVIMTTNLGSEIFCGPSRKPLGFLSGSSDADTDTLISSERKGRVLEIARAAFPPELWNRIDERIVFEPLDRNDVRKIARIMLDTSSRLMKANNGISYSANDEVIEYLIENGGYDPSLGARPLRQTIQRLVEAPLAGKIISKDIVPGQALQVTVNNGQIIFNTSTG